MGSTKTTCPVLFSEYSLRQSKYRHMYLELIAAVFIYDAFNKNVHLRKVNNRGGRSANKFRNPQICGLTKICYIYLRTVRKSGFAI
jgi:hypothetical protein